MKRLFFLFLNIVFLAGYGQDWHCYQKENSAIPDNVIKTLSIDRSGNIWFVTGDCFYGGDVVRFDGKDFTVYDSSNSAIPDRFVTSLAFDSSGVWMGSRYHGISYYDGIKWMNWSAGNSNVPDNHIKYATTDNNGNVWICTDKGMAVYMDQKWKLFDKSNSALPVNSVNCIAFEKNSKAFWVATDKGVLYCKSLASLIKLSDVPAIVYDTTNSELPDEMVTQVVIDDAGAKWFSAWGGIVKFDGSKWELYTHGNSGLPDYCQYIITPEKEHLWIATNMGLFLFDKKVIKSYTPANSKIPSYFVNLVVLGRNGIKWIATQNGLVKLNTE